MSAAVSLRDVSKTFHLYSTLSERISASLLGRSRTTPAAHVAVDHVSLDINVGESIGILGINGAGKSTLLQIITGVLTPSSGSMAINGRISALLELGAGFDPSLTGRQNAEFQCRMNGIPTEEIASTLTKIQDFADIGHFFDQPMRIYSSGMYVRVAFAAAVAVDPDILIVDEALAVGDARFQAKCFARFQEFREQGKTIIFVTHGTDLVAKYCSRAIVLHKGSVAFDGEPARAINQFMHIMNTGTLVDTAERDDTAHGESELRSGFDNTAQSRPKLFDASDYSDRLALRPFYNRNEYRYGHGAAKIVDACFIDDAVNASGHCRSGNRVAFAMRIVAEKNVPAATSGIIVKTVDGLRVYGTSGIMLGAQPFSLKAREDLQIIVEFDVSLIYGDYFIDLAISEYKHGDYTVIDCRQSALHLTVESSGEFNGLADLRCGLSEPLPV